MINVGLTEMHGIVQEYSACPPEGISYSVVETDIRVSQYVFKSAAKGVYARVNSKKYDIIEAPLFPILTDQPWIYTPAHFSSAGAFDFFGLPTPRTIKMLYVKHLLRQNNLKKLLFKSEFGRQSLLEYGGISDSVIVSKTDVVYPVIRQVPDSMIVYQNKDINILFVGEFFRKGGANVVDAFLRLNKEYNNLKLTICSSENFQTSNQKLKEEYLRKINTCDNIIIGFVERDKLMTNILPNTDIYLCPTYKEAWGFSIQEAMAYGIPIVTTNINAIPEMVEHGTSHL